MAATAHAAPRSGRANDSQIAQNTSFEDLKTLIHSKLVDKLDLSRLGDLEGDTLRREIRLVVEHLCDTETRCSTAASASG
jgi:pilus assembly protein CpaF